MCLRGFLATAREFRRPWKSQVGKSVEPVQTSCSPLNPHANRSTYPHISFVLASKISGAQRCSIWQRGEGINIEKILKEPKQPSGLCICVCVFVYLCLCISEPIRHDFPPAMVEVCVLLLIRLPNHIIQRNNILKTQSHHANHLLMCIRTTR